MAYQIDVDNAALTLPPPGPVGPNPGGFFTDEDVDQGIEATTVPAAIMNSLMLEICNTVTGAGLSLNKASQTQLYTAINTMIATYITTNFSNNLTWSVVTTNTQMQPYKGYQTNSGSSINFTLPVTCPVNAIIKVARYNGQFVILQNSGQQIHCGTQNTTQGVTGSLTSNQACSYLELMCTVANTHFMALGNWGNFQTT